MQQRYPASVGASLILLALSGSCLFAQPLQQQIAQQQGALLPADLQRSVQAQAQDELQLRDRLEHERQIAQQREISERADAELRDQARVAQAATPQARAERTAENAPREVSRQVAAPPNPPQSEAPIAPFTAQTGFNAALFMRASAIGILAGLCTVLPAMVLSRRFSL